MGLDITAYSQLEPVVCTDDECDHIRAFAYSPFTASFRGLPILETNDQFIVGRCYRTTPVSGEFRFNAGSYTGYGMWRDDLREQFNPDVAGEAPFYELIHFADNEGTIGPLAAVALLTDFVDHRNSYSPPGWAGPPWVQRYEDWTAACRTAADGGLIKFH